MEIDGWRFAYDGWRLASENWQVMAVLYMGGICGRGINYLRGQGQAPRSRAGEVVSGMAFAVTGPLEGAKFVLWGLGLMGQSALLLWREGTRE